MLPPDLVRSLPWLLDQQVFGQAEAMEMVCRAIEAKNHGLRQRPLNFLFMGSTGTGKTHIGKVLARTLYDNDESLIHIQGLNLWYRMRQGPPTVRNLALDQLEALRFNPNQIVLVEDVQALCPGALNLLCQPLEDGVLTVEDNDGIDCSQAIFVFTSREGARHIYNSETDHLTFATKQRVQQEMLNLLPSPFRTCLDYKMVLCRLSPGALSNVLDVYLTEVANRKSRIPAIRGFRVLEEAKVHLSQAAHNPNEGAHKVRKVIHASIINTMVKLDSQGNIMHGDTIVVDYDRASGEVSVVAERQ